MDTPGYTYPTAVEDPAVAGAGVVTEDDWTHSDVGGFDYHADEGGQVVHFVCLGERVLRGVVWALLTLDMSYAVDFTQVHRGPVLVIVWDLGDKDLTLFNYVVERLLTERRAKSLTPYAS